MNAHCSFMVTAPLSHVPESLSAVGTKWTHHSDVLTSLLFVCFCLFFFRYQESCISYTMRHDLLSSFLINILFSRAYINFVRIFERLKMSPIL